MIVLSFGCFSLDSLMLSCNRAIRYKFEDILVLYSVATIERVCKSHMETILICITGLSSR